MFVAFIQLVESLKKRITDSLKEKIFLTTDCLKLELRYAHSSSISHPHSAASFDLYQIPKPTMQSYSFTVV